MQCDNCVEGFDHHCNWIGNCVVHSTSYFLFQFPSSLIPLQGQRNHRYFVSFVVMTTVLAWYLMAASIVHLAIAGGVSASWADIGSVILVVSMACTNCFMTSMSCLHLGLVAS